MQKYKLPKLISQKIQKKIFANRSKRRNGYQKRFAKEYTKKYSI